ncbi:MAG: Holliday junction branch migration protein RuvA [Chitinophagaceae bacterium]|nr:Holliday junction branch migration protein RuvA [Chitinophagaceae bacterium]MCB9044742.1 Holliday junction branch migration protein RuvA [Chitinophagales bacterium]
MFAYIEGDLTYKSPSLVYLSVNGLGYEVNITLQTFSKIQHLDKCRLYTHLQVREDAWVMYGFADEQERETFRHLLSISGVGAATARLILSSLKPEELGRIISTEDVNSLQKVKGIGAKTAQRIILELKGKLQSLPQDATFTGIQHNTIENDALFALVNLGINKAAAQAAIGKIENAGSLTVEDIIKKALRLL